MKRAAPVILGLAYVLVGCTTRAAPTNEIATGITLERDTTAGVQILDIDLLTAHAHPVVVAENVTKINGNYVGDAKTVLDWADKYSALGGMNAGYFGDTYDQLGKRKQIVGLAVVDGAVVAPIRYVSPQSRPDLKLVRSAVGFGAGGAPDITWATGSARGRLYSFSTPSSARTPQNWTVHTAVSCGPHLFHDGQRRIADREEWLVSPGKLPRAFIAYDRENGQPRHLIFGRADAMEFADVANYLTDYFARTHQTTPREAMCLDGGPSAQLVYRQEGRLMDAEPTGVLVPTAILLVPNVEPAKL